MKKYFSLVLFPVFFSCTFAVNAEAAAQGAIIQDKHETVKAEVLEVTSTEQKVIPGTDTVGPNQNIQVQMLEGTQKNKIVTVENDYLKLKKGDIFYLLHTTDGGSGAEYYTVQDPYRLPALFVLIGIFVLAVFIFGGMQGIRGLLSLIGSFLLILYVLLPGILHGYSPLLVTTGVSSLIIIVGSYITHGFNKTTTAAVMGMISTVIITGGLAYVAVHATQLSGLGTEESVYVNLNARGSIDVVGILLGGIMIGLLGVLYDVAIGQAISVEELSVIAPHVPRGMIYKRALRIGREHIGALVNTLAIAYVGAALPLLLLFSQGTAESVWVTMNREIFSTEIVRIMIGSIGLVLAVPITTFIAVWYLMGRKEKDAVDPGTLGKEQEALSEVGHSHKH